MGQGILRSKTGTSRFPSFLGPSKFSNTFLIYDHVSSSQTPFFAQSGLTASCQSLSIYRRNGTRASLKHRLHPMTYGQKERASIRMLWLKKNTTYCLEAVTWALLPVASFINKEMLWS